MPGKYCCVCKNTTSKDPASLFTDFHPIKRSAASGWRCCRSQKTQLKSYCRVCSTHFPDGDPNKLPTVTLGKKFCSPMKKGSRAKHAQKRRELYVL